MENYFAVLKNEFEAGEGSFLLQIRTQMNWDRTAFTRLIAAMHTYCMHHAGTDLVERWVAEGFWYITTFTRTWTTHVHFPHHHDEAYYVQAYQQLDDLAYWFFIGSSPYEPGHTFEVLK